MATFRNLGKTVQDHKITGHPSTIRPINHTPEGNVGFTEEIGCSTFVWFSASFFFFLLKLLMCHFIRLLCELSMVPLFIAKMVQDLSVL